MASGGFSGGVTNEKIGPLVFPTHVMVPSMKAIFPEEPSMLIELMEIDTLHKIFKRGSISLFSPTNSTAVYISHFSFRSQNFSQSSFNRSHFILDFKSLS